MGMGNHWISFSELLTLFLDRMVDLNQILSMVGSAFSSRREKDDDDDDDDDDNNNNNNNNNNNKFRPGVLEVRLVF